jgi:hypothetical protein
MSLYRAVFNERQEFTESSMPAAAREGNAGAFLASVAKSALRNKEAVGEDEKRMVGLAARHVGDVIVLDLKDKATESGPQYKDATLRVQITRGEMTILPRLPAEQATQADR